MSIRRRGTSWQVRVTLQGHGRVERTLPLGATRQDAKELEAQLLRGQLNGILGRADEPTLAELTVRWLRNEATGLKDHAGVVARVRVMTPHLARPVSQAVAAAEDLVRESRAAGNSPATINRKLAILRRVLRLAFRRWQWPGVTQDYSQLIGLLPENNQRHVYLTPAQATAVAAVTGQHNRAAGQLVLFAALTGLRRGEVLGLTPANVFVPTPEQRAAGASAMVMLGSGTKTGRPRAVPLTPEAEQIAAAELPWRCSDQQLRDAFDAARAALDLQHVRFHDLRHTYASWLAQSGAPLTTIRDALGHGSVSTTNRYAHLAAQHIVDASRRLPKLGAGSRAGRKPTGGAES